jgi:hypothetical protein
MLSVLKMIGDIFGLKCYDNIISYDICEVCGDEEASLFCLHRTLCVECAGSGLINCVDCNPNNRFYIVDCDIAGKPKIKFLD